MTADEEAEAMMERETRRAPQESRREFWIRFSLRQRIEHALIMVLFLALALTGFPQKFFEAAWAQWMIVHLGGIDRVHWVHRFCGVAFSLVAMTHLTVVVTLAAAKRIELSMIPTRKDFRDAVRMLRYYVGLADDPPEFDRYDYRQKFEYWGLVLGGILMIATGFVLYRPTSFTRFLPGQVIPAALVAHGSEGLLAFLVVIVWHIYNAHLNPDVFPFDTSIFTGRISDERMRREHSLEVRRRLGPEESAPPAVGERGGSP